MKYLIRTEKIEVPKDVKITIKAREITVKGKRGELKKSYKHIKADITQEKDQIIIHTYMNSYKQASVLNTLCSHIKNMIKGVRYGFRYKMHTVKKHFPIELAVKNGAIEVGRFLGQKDVKIIKLLEGVTAKKNEKDGEEIWVDGNDIDKVALTCAHVFQSCLPKDKDRRKFLDGIFVSEKTTVEQP